MGTQLRQWAIRLLAAVALPIMLTLGLGAAANAQPVLASHVTSSSERPSATTTGRCTGPTITTATAFMPSKTSADLTRTAKASTDMTTAASTGCGTCMSRTAPAIRVSRKSRRRSSRTWVGLARRHILCAPPPLAFLLSAHHQGGSFVTCPGRRPPVLPTKWRCSMKGQCGGARSSTAWISSNRWSTSRACALASLDQVRDRYNLLSLAAEDVVNLVDDPLNRVEVVGAIPEGLLVFRRGTLDSGREIIWCRGAIRSREVVKIADD